MNSKQAGKGADMRAHHRPTLVMRPGFRRDDSIGCPVRLRRMTGLILLAALAGCGSGQKANNAAAAPAANAAAAPAPAAPANAVAASAPAAGEAAGIAEFRGETYRGCVEGGNETAPPGTPIERILESE